MPMYEHAAATLQTTDLHTWMALSALPPLQSCYGLYVRIYHNLRQPMPMGCCGSEGCRGMLARACEHEMYCNLCVWCRKLPPGRLHDLRSASVNNERLAACAAVHRLHAPLRHFSQRLLADVTVFLEGLRAAAGSALQRTSQGGPFEMACQSPCRRPCTAILVVWGCFWLSVNIDTMAAVR